MATLTPSQLSALSPKLVVVVTGEDAYAVSTGDTVTEYHLSNAGALASWCLKNGIQFRFSSRMDLSGQFISAEQKALNAQLLLREKVEAQEAARIAAHACTSVHEGENGHTKTDPTAIVTPRYSRFSVDYVITGTKAACMAAVEHIKGEYHPCGYGTHIVGQSGSDIACRIEVTRGTSSD